MPSAATEWVGWGLRRATARSRAVSGISPVQHAVARASIAGVIKATTDSFASMAPYRVSHEDGSEEEFRAWLNAQLDLRRQAMAKGGAP